MKIVSRNTFFEQACFLNCGSDEGYRTGPTGCIVTCMPRKADTPETQLWIASGLNPSCGPPPYHSWTAVWRFGCRTYEYWFRVASKHL